MEGADVMCLVTRIFGAASLWSTGKLLQVHGDLVCPTVHSVYTLNQGTRRFHLKCVQCEHIEPKSKEVSFNMKGIFSCVRYYRKEIFAKGRGPVGLLILKEKY